MDALALARFFSSWREVARAQDLRVITLGRVENLPVLFLNNTSKASVHLLLAAGFHGNEPAGPLGLLEWAKKRRPEGVAVSFLPLVNPTGFRDCTRNNSKGQPTNRGWIRAAEGEKLSVEGRAIRRQFDEILRSARDGFLTLHEDWDATAFYAYIYASRQKRDEFARKMLKAGYAAFGLFNGYYAPDDVKIKDGLAETKLDSTFEDLIYSTGVPWVCTTETPCHAGKKLRSLAGRVQGTVALIDAFVGWVQAHPRSQSPSQRPRGR